MFRRDYVANSNDSYWLTNPEQPLEGFAADHRQRAHPALAAHPARAGDARAAAQRHRRLRRQQVQPQQAAADRVQRPPLRRRALRAQLAEFCHANPILTGSGGPVDVSEACPALDGFDEKQNLDSTGAILFRRFMSRLGEHPVHEPVRRRRPRPHPVRARHLRPGGRRGARRRGHRPARRRDPARRGARRLPVRDPRQRADPDPRRPRRPGRLQRDQNLWTPPSAIRTSPTARASSC